MTIYLYMFRLKYEHIKNYISFTFNCYSINEIKFVFIYLIRILCFVLFVGK